MSRNEGGDNDDQYFEEENLAFLPADHPLLARVQKALQKTLEDEHERVNLQLIEKENRLRKLEREKEDVGVQLYGVQQNLADLQLNFEQTHENYNLINKLRIEGEQKLQVLNQEYSTKKAQVDELNKKCNRANDDLSKLNKMLKQIEDYNNDVKSQIQVTRRTTYRAEENITNLEKQKKKQDFLIDHMNEEIKKLNEQKIIIEAQLISQREETRAAQQILKEAYVEMENIIASKKNLLERWQKCLLEMQRRDHALQVIRDALNAQHELNIQIGTELTGINNEIEKEQEISEKLEGTNRKLNLERRHLEKEEERLRHEETKYRAQYAILQQSLASTEQEINKVNLENKNIDDQMQLIESNIMKMHTETKKLYDEIINKINDHKTSEKTTANLMKQARIIGQRTEDIQIQIEDIDNEIARVKIDQLNTSSQIELLKQKKREVSRERKEKEEKVLNFELEIRQGHDINEKKQSYVGQLNKVHDDLKSNTSEISREPLEAQKNKLKREIDEKKQQCDMMQRDWMKNQTRLVDLQNSLMGAQEKVSELNTRKTILEQKKIRLNNIYNQHEKEIKQIKIGLKNLQTEMNKLNDGLSKNQASEEKLKNENFNIESEFVEKLKELEKDSVKLEVEIDRLKEEKAELLASIVEAERQILLWERKITLEKEMQEALDPNIGQSEISLLKKEIHRMELRLEELRRKQDDMIKEMERSVKKRDTIQIKYMKNEDDEIKNKKGSKDTHISKQIQTLKTTLNQTTQNIKQLDAATRQRKAQQEQIEAQIEDVNEKYSLTENDLHEKAMLLTEKKLERLRNVFQILELQSQAKAYEAVATNKFKLDYPEDTLRREYEKKKAVNENIREVLLRVMNDYPQYGKIVQQIVDI